MKQLLYLIVGYISRIHDKILTLNDGALNELSDNQLHFLVIGIIGMLLFIFVHPLFKSLARHGHTIVISWIHVFTLILVITFAIEIGQKISNTGSMEFSDIVFGIFGFIAMFAVYAVIRWIILLIIRPSQCPDNCNK